jgi:hypothetical protein
MQIMKTLTRPDAGSPADSAAHLPVPAILVCSNMTPTSLSSEELLGCWFLPLYAATYHLSPTLRLAVPSRTGPDPTSFHLSGVWRAFRRASRVSPCYDG